MHELPHFSLVANVSDLRPPEPKANGGSVRRRRWEIASLFFRFVEGFGHSARANVSHPIKSHTEFLIVIIILISRNQWITITIKITIRTENTA